MPHAEHRTGGAGDPAEHRQYCPHLRGDRGTAAPGGADGLCHRRQEAQARRDDFFRQNPAAADNMWLATTKAPQDYTQARFTPGCWLFFGKETAGLPEEFRMAHYDRCIRLPMRSEARSLNLSNSVAILTYEALRQNGFPGLSGTGEMARRRE